MAGNPTSSPRPTVPYARLKLPRPGSSCRPNLPSSVRTISISRLLLTLCAHRVLHFLVGSADDYVSQPLTHARPRFFIPKLVSFASLYFCSDTKSFGDDDQEQATVHHSGLIHLRIRKTVRHFHCKIFTQHP